MFLKKIIPILKRAKDFRFNLGVNRNRDWKILAMFFIIVTALNLAWGLYSFWRVYTGEYFEVEDNFNIGSVETFNKEDIDKTLEVFKQRKLRVLEAGSKEYYPDPGA